MPMIAFIGVRISWLMLARNSPFASVASSARRRAVSSSFTSCAEPLGVLFLLVACPFQLRGVVLERLLRQRAVGDVARGRVDDALLGHRRRGPFAAIVRPVAARGTGSRS